MIFNKKKGSSIARGLYIIHKEVETLLVEVVAGVSAIDAVVAIGIDQLVEVLALLHQRLGVFCGIAEMDIVVGHSVA